MASELHRLVARQRLEPDEHRVAAHGAPRGTVLQELAARKGDDERSARALAVHAEALDEVEHRRLKRVHVLEDEQHGVVARQAVDHGDESRLDLGHERRLVSALGQAEKERQPLRQAGGCAVA